MCIDLHFWPNVGHDGDIVSHTDTVAYGNTHGDVACESWIYTICVPFTFTVLWYGCLDIGGYGCHENNLIMILLHSDGCLV